MKPDGVTMETMEPTEPAAVAEPSLSPGLPSQDNTTKQAPSPLQTEQAANAAAPPAAQEANGKPVPTDSKAKPKAVASKKQPITKTTGTSVATSRLATAPNRRANESKYSQNVPAKPAAVKKTAPTTGASATGAVPRRPMGAPVASSTVKKPEKKPVGAARTTTTAAAAAAIITNGVKQPPALSSTPKKKPAAPASRPAAFAAPKPSTSTTSKPDRAAISKTTRPATGPSTSRPAATSSRPLTATAKPSTTATTKAVASRVTTAPSTGRTAAAQPPKSEAAKKDVSRPASSLAKRPTTAATSAAAKKPEPSKPMAVSKLSAPPRRPLPGKAADPKPPQPKSQEPPKPAPIKKPVGSSTRFPPLNKAPLGRTPPASPANKPAGTSTTPAKRVPKLTQAVPPFSFGKKTGVQITSTPAEAQRATSAQVVATAAATVPAETEAGDIVSSAEGPLLDFSVPEETPSQVLAQDAQSEVALQETDQGRAAAGPSPLQSPVREPLPQSSPAQDQMESSGLSLTTQEQMAATTSSSMVSPPEPSEPDYLITAQTSSTSNIHPSAESVMPQVTCPSNLNEEEDEDEEEREGSQQVSVSEMSGTTQPTEESRPGSAGPLGSGWRLGGALHSELDSEDVSGSQQGASELSAPGVLEGTESMDDLGDGSLKGAIDMEGASAGSPDFEKVPDIPTNDFEEDEDDEDDEDDRVCDMDVGSERADDPLRPRHDNDVDDEEDEDVEMASEGVTESGLESYGNADEDDFAEDERLDNLNRVAQPPPPLLPSAPAAQWDQPNLFADPWAQPVQPHLLENVSQPLQLEGASAASPSIDLWQADSETPTQSPAHAWLELGSVPLVPECHELPHHSSIQGESQNPEVHSCMDQSCLSPMQTLVPAPPSVLAMSTTLSSDTSTPEDLGEYIQEGLQTQAAQSSVSSHEPNLVQNLGLLPEGRDGVGEEAGSQPAEITGGEGIVPTSNPSSASVTEDEASDTEGEAQLDQPLDIQVINNLTFNSQPPATRSLSTVEEGEEVDPEEMEGGMGADTSPPSANSGASCGFDTMTTASNSNAQSTGESCTKSPGIFSLEELSEEAKDPCLFDPPQTQQCPAEHDYIQCVKQEVEPAEDTGEEAPGSEEALGPSTLTTLQDPEENSDDIQPPYYSAICEKTENSFAGFTALPHPHRRDHSAYPRSYCDFIKPHGGAVTPAKLTCADLPPRSRGQQALSPQLRRLEQHQRQLVELQQRREQQGRPMEEVEQERKKREEEEQRKKREEAEEEIKRNREEEEKRRQEEMKVMKKEEEELKQRRDLELQLQQQQEELKQRQQIMQWQQELQQSNQGQAVLLSPSSGLCTIYEALENSDDEEGEEDGIEELGLTKKPTREKPLKEETVDHRTIVASDEGKTLDSSPSPRSSPPPPDSPQRPGEPSQDEEGSSPSPAASPERPSPLELDWGKKVDIVQQLINQTLLLNGDGCSSLLLLPGGSGGTLSPLESSLWPSLLPPLTPPSATVTSVSSFSPETTGSSAQGEWTVVELETHH
ncbi:uncharacterized protein prr36a [Genypterus blacodes]|uniref:uncharacterized protein prr36a n=1 Tax=Genypterus blacodes TaxID=154954 RepID=UPI003F7730FD